MARSAVSLRNILLLSIAFVSLLSVLTDVYAEAGNSRIRDVHWVGGAWGWLVFTVEDPDGIDFIAVWSNLGDKIHNQDEDCDTEVEVWIDCTTQGVIPQDFPLRVEITDCQDPAATDTRYVYEPKSKGGGLRLPVDKFSLLAPYIGLVLTIAVAAATTTVYVKRGKERTK